MWCWRRTETIKCSEKVTNEDVLERERSGEKKTLLDNILRRKVNWIGHVLRRYFLLQDVIERQMTEVKGEGRDTNPL